MWVIVLLDLPTDTRKFRKQYQVFRKRLLEDGFIIMQYSVLRHGASDENALVHVKRVKSRLPLDGRSTYRKNYRQTIWQD
jgi:CRISPR-associated protein Cas2